MLDILDIILIAVISGSISALAVIISGMWMKLELSEFKLDLQEEIRKFKNLSKTMEGRVERVIGSAETRLRNILPSGAGEWVPIIKEGIEFFKSRQTGPATNEPKPTIEQINAAREELDTLEENIKNE